MSVVKFCSVSRLLYSYLIPTISLNVHWPQTFGSLLIITGILFNIFYNEELSHCKICIALWYLVRGDFRPVITLNLLTVSIVIISS